MGCWWKLATEIERLELSDEVTAYLLPHCESPAGIDFDKHRQQDEQWANAKSLRWTADHLAAGTELQPLRCAPDYMLPSYMHGKPYVRAYMEGLRGGRLGEDDASDSGEWVQILDDTQYLLFTGGLNLRCETSSDKPVKDKCSSHSHAVPAVAYTPEWWECTVAAERGDQTILFRLAKRGGSKWGKCVSCSLFNKKNAQYKAKDDKNKTNEWRECEAMDHYIDEDVVKNAKGVWEIIPRHGGVLQPYVSSPAPSPPPSHPSPSPSHSAPPQPAFASPPHSQAQILPPGPAPLRISSAPEAPDSSQDMDIDDPELGAKGSHGGDEHDAEAVTEKAKDAVVSGADRGPEKDGRMQVGEMKQVDESSVPDFPVDSAERRKSDLERYEGLPLQPLASHQQGLLSFAKSGTPPTLDWVKIGIKLRRPKAPPGPAPWESLDVQPNHFFDRVDTIVSATATSATSDKFYSLSMVNAICLAADSRAKPTSSDIRYRPNIIDWIPNPAFPSGTNVPNVPLLFNKGGMPLPGLGASCQWRSKNTVSVVLVKFNTHWIALSVFGPSRLVFIVDGAGGCYDDDDLDWESLFKARLDYELREGWVDAEANEGWRIVPNTTAFRDSIGWFRQNDGYSCGPLAVAAVLLLLQGFRPDVRNVGLSLAWNANSAETRLGARSLRDSQWMLVVDHVVCRGKGGLGHGAVALWFERNSLKGMFEPFSTFFGRSIDGTHWKAVERTGLGQEATL